MISPLARIPAGSQNRLALLPGGLKAGLAVALLLWIAATPFSFPEGLLLPAAIVLAALAFGHVSPLLVIRRMIVFEVLAVTTSLLALFRPDGWHVFWLLLAKATLSLTVAVLFSLSTAFVELLSLLRTMRLPKLFVTTIALLYRYLFVLTDQAGKMTRARASRTFTPGRSRIWVLHSGVIGMLAVRSIERAERVYDAMRARGWQ
ncbi:MAG: energy-coupling factor transporter transmembrane component T [Bacteroidota bacterium]